MKLALALLVCAPLVHAAAPGFISGQSAKAIIGQQAPSYLNTTASSQIVGGVSGLAWSNGMLYVADGNLIGALPVNNRVLLFPTGYPELQNLHAAPTNPAGNSACPLCGYLASTVIGQVDFASTNPGTTAVPASTTAGSIWSPTAVATNGTILAIADTNNNRVLIWNSIPTSPAVAPNVVLGQPDFTTVQVPNTVTASTLRAPQGVWIQNGKLYVADTANSRILVWNSIPTTNNQAADFALGQTNLQSAVTPPLTSTNPATSASQLLNPIGVTSDGTHLIVSDFGFDRVLIWNSIPTQMDQAADVVVGQVDMTKAIANNTSAMCASNGTDSSNNPTYPHDCEKTLDHPRFALSDGTRLFIADSGNDRVLIYNQIPTANAAAADIVLGQPNFTSDIITNQSQSAISTTVDNTASVDTIPTPLGLAYDGVNLYVSDAIDDRVLVFAPGDISVGYNNVRNTASKAIQQEGYVALALAVGQTKVVAGDTVTITIQGTNYVYTIVAADTLDTITQHLIDTINGKLGGGAADPNVTALLGATPDTVYLSSKGVSNGFDTISLAATTSNTADITATASFTYLTGGNSGTAAPGALVEIDDPNTDANGNLIPGLELADFTGSANTQNALPTILSATVPEASVQAFMDGTAVPIVSVSPAQVVVQVPFAYADRNSTSVYVLRTHPDGSVSVTIPSPLIIAPASPGLFAVPGTSSPQPAFGAVHQAGNPSATIAIGGTIQAGDVVNITVSSRAYNYTVQASDTLVTITAALVSAINTANDPQVTALPSGAFTSVVLTAKQAGSAGSGIPVTATVTAASGKTSATETATAYTSSTCCATSGSGPVTPGNPAQPNEVITLRATGLGLVSDPSGNAIAVTTGAPYAGPQPNSATNSVNATVGGSTGQVISAGLAPGGIGVYNVQVLMPASLPASGAANVYIAQNAFISNTVTLPVGAAGASQVNMFIDQPTAQAQIEGGTITAYGWAVDSMSAVANVSVFVDGTSFGTATPRSRPDVCNAYPASIGCGAGSPDNVGWTIQINTNSLPRGSHTLSVVGTAANGNQNTATTTFDLNNPVKVYIDAFTQQSTVSGTVPLVGWAISIGAPVSNVTLSVDGNRLSNPSVAARPDVCSAYPAAVDCLNGNLNVGWNLAFDTATLPNGTHTLAATGTDANGQRATAGTTFTVSNAAPAGMMVFIDSSGSVTSTLTGMATLSGWAINASAPVGSVKIYIDGALQSSVTPSLPRPDVCAVYPASVGCPSGANLGWSSTLDTTLLADGAHTVAVTAFSNNQSYTATAPITIANGTIVDPVQVSIDNPATGLTATGTIGLYGWAISDEAAINSVSVSVDGVSYGNATYGSGRPDVCNAFPNRLGCPNVGWSSVFDTTLVPDGLHTLTMTATAANGQRRSQSTKFTASNQSTSHVSMYIDNSLSAPITGTLPIVGWAGADNSIVTTVTILVDGMAYGTTTDTVFRPDVCAARPTLSGCPQASLGWNFSLDTNQIPPGAHTLEARAITQSGEQLTVAYSMTVRTSAAPPLRAYLDQPSSGATLVGTASISGWAVNGSGQLGSVSVSIDGVRYSAPVAYAARPDVCAFYSLPGGCPNAGWSLLLDTTQLVDGSHTISVTGTAAGQNWTISTTVTVANLGNAGPVQIGIDSTTPEGSPLSALVGTQTLSGFAGSEDGYVTRVVISIDGVPQPQHATYGVTRSGGCSVVGSANCPNVGWTYSLDTTLLANGTHTLDVTATTLGQNSTVSTTFSVTN